MFSRTTTITNETGLHARPASDFVKAANEYQSEITIKKAGEESGVNAKSIIFLLTLGLAKGAEIEISADGEDEEAAVNGLVALIESGFGE